MLTLQTGLSNKNRVCGFTLIELLVVLLILGLFSALLSIRIEGLFSGGDLRFASRIIINEINNLRGKAAHTRKDQVLGLEVGHNILYPVESAPHREITPEWMIEEKEIPLKATYLPEGVRFEDVVVLSKGKVQEGEARIRFFANGCIERSLIHLRNETDKVYTLEINPLTGYVRVYDTYVDQKMSK